MGTATAGRLSNSTADGGALVCWMPGWLLCREDSTNRRVLPFRNAMWPSQPRPTHRSRLLTNALRR